MTKHLFLQCKAAFTIVCVILLSMQCSDEQLTLTATSPANLELNTATVSAGAGICSCTYLVPANATIIDGKALGLQPGNIIGLDANVTYKNLTFRNINGTIDNPIIIRNCGGIAHVDGTGKAFG